MEIIRIASHVTAFIRPDEGANVGLIHTPKGMVVVDTTSYPGDMSELLQTAMIKAEEVRWVVNTHCHSDHTWGNQLFNCPILAHHRCLEIMRDSLSDNWSEAGIQGLISQMEKSDPKRAEKLRREAAGLRITLPTETFEERHDLDMGGVKLEIIHFDAHMPDLSVVWLPGEGILFASDLIFQGRYPYIFDSDIQAWIAALNKLPEFRARVIVPGHGLLCGEAEMAALRDYLETTWNLTAGHIAKGHSADEAAADPAYPRYAEKQYERLHQANIRYIYEQLTK